MNCSCLKFGAPDTCSTCRYGFCPRCTYPQSLQCRRHAPMPVEGSSQCTSPAATYPMVGRGDWCGDYEADKSGSEDHA